MVSQSVSRLIEILWVFLLFLLAEIAVRTTPLTRIAPLFGLSISDAECTRFATNADVEEWARRRIRIVTKVSLRWPGDGPCLRRSLVTGSRIRRLGPTLHIGVVPMDDRIAAHSWVAVQGLALDSTAGAYRELKSR